MKYKSLITLVCILFCGPTKSAQTCQTKEGLLGAHYTLVNSHITAIRNEEPVVEKTINSSTLWRMNQKVLSVNGEKSITWFKLNNGSVKKTAHFDRFKRSIEYQAKPTSSERWQQIRQLIPKSKRQSLQLSSSKIEGCYQQDTYQWKNKQLDLQGKLVWNADLNLVIALEIKQDNQQRVWKLEKIESDETVIEQEFVKRTEYQATDFADIGDNESDSFLIKMINLGFIEHGSSGIYNAYGESMAIEHNH